MLGGRYSSSINLHLEFLRGEMNRIDDLVVTGTAADVPGDRFFDIFRGRFLGAIEQRFYRHDESRRTVTALHGAGVDKSLLHGMQFVAVGETLDGCNLCAVGVG